MTLAKIDFTNFYFKKKNKRGVGESEASLVRRYIESLFNA